MMNEIKKNETNFTISLRQHAASIFLILMKQTDEKRKNIHDGRCGTSNILRSFVFEINDLRQMTDIQ